MAFHIPNPRITAGSLFVSPIFLLLLLISHPFIFCVASADPITPAAAKGSRVQIALIISISLVFLLALLFGMVFLFRFLKLKKQRGGNQVESVDFDAEKENSGGGGGSVRIYNWEEIKDITMNFARVIGSGGFSNVYFANLPSSIQGAVKVHLNKNRLNQVFKQELDILLRLRHGNIVKLLGYCDEQEEGAMVFEYVAEGNLQEMLHETESVIPWSRRTAMVFELTQAIEYLHEKCELQIVHGDIKASNVLLDESLNCKLCDFGSAKMGFSSMVQPPSASPGAYRNKPLMIGSPGYTDPHYLRTGIASKKNDVYGLGVIILELVTGKPAFSPEKGQQLTSMLAPILSEISEHESDEKIAELVDPRLGGDLNLDEARTMVSVAARCLHQSPTLRPSATQILEIFQQKFPHASFATTLPEDSLIKTKIDSDKQFHV